MQIIKYDDRFRESVIELMMQLQDHERALSADRPPSWEVSEKQLDYLVSSCTPSVGIIYLAVIESRAVGIIVAFQDQEHEGTHHVYPKYRKFCLISDLVVSEAHRGAGIAAALMDKVYEYTQLLGFNYVRLGVLSTNIPARRFYEKNGFDLYEVTYRKEIQ